MKRLPRSKPSWEQDVRFKKIRKHSSDLKKYNNKKKTKEQAWSWLPSRKSSTGKHPLTPALTWEAASAAGPGCRGRTEEGQHWTRRRNSLPSAPPEQYWWKQGFAGITVLGTSRQHSCVGQRSHAPSEPWLTACDAAPAPTPLRQLLRSNSSLEISRAETRHHPDVLRIMPNETEAPR